MMVQSPKVALAALAATIGLVAGTYIGHVRTNCGEVIQKDGTSVHQCWFTSDAEDSRG